MGSKTTSIDLRRRGVTLVETLIGLCIGAVVATLFAALISGSARSLLALTNWLSLDQNNRTAIDAMTRDIRQANRVTAFATNSITLEGPDGTPLTFRYDPAARKVTRVKGKETTLLLPDVDVFTCTMWQRNLVKGTYKNYPTADVNQCKVVGLYWNCSRTILGRKSNVSGAQSTRVVIRQQ
jgi:hypothetical protein